MTTRAQIRPQKPEDPLICDPSAPLDMARALLRSKKIPSELLAGYAERLDGHYPFFPVHRLHSAIWLALDKAVRPDGKPFKPRKSHVARVLEALAALHDQRNADRESLHRHLFGGRTL